MWLVRSAAAVTVTAVALVWVVDPAGVAADPPLTKQQKFAQKQKAKAKAEAAAAKTTVAKEPAAQVAAVRPKPVVHPPADVAAQIDAQIDRRLAAANSTASPPCTDAEFLRRASLDLTGVIPTVERTRRFLDDPAPDKRAKLVDELLADPNFGRHQSDLWVPKLFPRESANRFVQREPFAKWFEEQFNENTPWDLFVSKLVTASGTVEDNPAVTYYLANRSVDKLTDTVSEHFLGLQLQCAQCHNHPFVAWKQTEYWGMAAFFAKVNPARPMNAAKGADNLKLTVTEGAQKSRVKDFFPESAKTVPVKFLGGPSPKVTPTEPLRPVLAKWLTAANNPYFGRAAVNRVWAQLFGRGIVDPVDDMHDGNEPSHPELLAALTKEFVGSGFDQKHLIRCVCASQAYQRASKPAAGFDPVRDKALFAHMAVKVMSPEQLFDSLGQVTGLTAAIAERAKKAGMKGAPAGPRDQFVSFFLAGAEQANPTGYDAGIPQALRLMNAPRFSGGPQGGRLFFKPGMRPAQVFDEIYLAALSRKPTAEEVTRLTKYVAKAGAPADAYTDVVWAVLNSSEFAMVR